jgi:hypothetical protein
MEMRVTRDGEAEDPGERGGREEEEEEEERKRSSRQPEERGNLGGRWK